MAFYAYFVGDGRDQSSLAVLREGDKVVPLIGREDSLEDLQEAAQVAADASGYKLVLVKFDAEEAVSEVLPSALN